MKNGEIVMIIILEIFFAFLIANFLGNKRKIGFGWSFFFSIFPNPIFGLIITLLSKKIKNKN